MNIREAYREFLFRVDKLATNSSQNIEYIQSVALVNKAQLHWAELRIKAAEATGTLSDETQLLLKDFSAPGQKQENFYKVDLPPDYFHRSRCYVSVKDCASTLEGKFTEEGNVGVLLRNAMTKPSVAWEETLVTVFNNALRVYFDDFSIDKVFLKYYRFPRPVDISGYIKDGGTPSTDVDLEFNGTNALEIIDLAARIASGDIGDVERYKILQAHSQEHN